MINFFNKMFQSDKNNYKIQSFTFFIPAPPSRLSGYREKQFDSIFYEFINKGYKILSFNTQACNGANQSGMWVICVVQATNSEAEKLSLNEIFNDQLKNKIEVKNEIEGLYYIDDANNEEI